MHRSVSVGLVALIVVLVVVGGPIGGVVTAFTGSGTAVPSPALQSSSDSDDVDSSDFESTTFEITVHENGSATWTFQYEQPLTEDSDGIETPENFRTFADEFESEETALYVQFTEQAELMAETAIEDTDREMAASNFNRSADIEGQLNAIGVVEMSFLWENFAETTDGQVVVGDVFQGLIITADQEIVVKPDGNLAFSSATPEPDSVVGSSIEEATSLHWKGEREFFEGHPRVVLESDHDGAVGGSSSLSERISPNGDASPWTLGLGVLLVGLALGAAGLWYRHRSTSDADGAEPNTGGSDDDTPSADAQPSDAPADPLEDEELLTDEDRVVKLIENNGGRMKQVDIVDETGWSKSKVSMLLSDMEDEGTISKLRVGRENIISLEGYEPEATKSPFDE
ncbi:helix-turn-helix transcriptional regulator [Halopiger goleimassiliensis]|uniref:helix-turn-helix transcriptional regulator n=1 Tax=Halopiger goleimassiliensis TaxID=1293048 RepID=UPI0006782C00|nr:hypothetical protein [Halopiger goleimassiliensis]